MRRSSGKMCGGKQRFDSPAQAQKARARTAWRKPKVRLVVYRCTSCSGFHLTSSVRWGPR